MHARWRAWATVFAFSEIIHSVHGVGKWTARRDLGDVRSHVPHEPVGKGTYRRIGIVHDQRETPGRVGRALYFQRRTDVVSVAGEAFGDVAAVAEIRADQFHSRL